MGEHLESWTITVTNHTPQDLTIRLSGSRLADVAAGATNRVGVSRADACAPGVNAITSDETRIALYDGEACEGDTWVIESSDLVPIEDTIYAPSS
jgi:hypothetical protein